MNTVNVTALGRTVSRRLRHTTRVAACALVIAAPIAKTRAQSRPRPDAPRPAVSGATSGAALSAGRRSSAGTSLRSTAIGALTGTAFAMAYYFVSERGDRANGCEPLNCALPFLSISGAFAGLFIGKELESQRTALAPRAGDAIEFGLTEAKLLASPNGIDVRDSLIAVVSDSGAQLLVASPQPKALRRRAAGLSAMRQVAIAPGRGTLLLGTGSALWETSLLNGPATRLADGAVDALATSNDAVLSASGSMVRYRRGSGTSVVVDSLDLGRSVSALAFDSTNNQWWAATDSQVVQLTSNNGALRTTAVALALPAPARAIATNGQWIAAALGDEGVVAWRRETVGAGGDPVRITDEPRFAYDLAFLDGVLFVAGGVDGLFQMSLTPTARVMGSSRQVQFATSVRAARGVLWVGDRVRQSVVRITP
ncbi:MAG: hypothetical protein IT353_21515 [Gemmatimonadaceae bacterium]|nr:hypothetical protein [Gemmatimonadaceae bacterium]